MIELNLVKKECVPCKGGVPPLKGKELEPLYQQLHNDWKLIDEHHLKRDFKFDDFEKALVFTNEIGALAEREGHHPDFELGYGYVNIATYTHKIDGLTESDFILAAKIDQIAGT